MRSSRASASSTTFHRYDGAGHAFQNFVRDDQYREAAEKDSWGRTLDFLKQAMA